MSLLKKIINKGSSDIASDEVIDPFNASPERNQEFAAQVNANQELNEMEIIEDERDKEEQAQADQLVVVHGAKVKMAAHLGEFKVLSNVPTTQGKLTGTIVEKQIPNFTFYDGFQLMSILGNWQNYGSYQVQDNEVLLKKSTLQVMGKMPGNTPPETGIIEIIDPGQINIPESVQTEGAPVPEDEELDFDIKLEHIKEDFVPLGIANYKGNKENDKIKFKIIISGKGVNEWHLKIEHKGNLIYQLFSATGELENVSIIDKANNPDNIAPPQESAESERFWPAGQYPIDWDGFDINGIYDSTIFTDGAGLTVSVIGKANQKTKKNT